ncbi:MAG: hypothetical protein ACRD4O_10855 [Bryobacteraceae bacterium]
MKWKASLFAGLIALCAFGLPAQADSLFAVTPNGGSEPSSPDPGFAWVDYSPAVNHIAYMLTSRDVIPAPTAKIANATQFLSAVTSDDTSMNVHSADDPGGGILGPLMTVPEASTLALVSLPLLLFGGAAARRKRRL